MGDITLSEIVDSVLLQQKKRGVDFTKMSERERLAYASSCALALHVEVSELADSWPFAPWKTTGVDEVNIAREIIDCIFFLVNIASCFGITAKELSGMFGWVLQNNYTRMSTGQHKSLAKEEGNDKID